MLPKRVYKVLNYLKDFDNFLLPSETPFKSDDFSGLKDEGYVSVSDRTTRLPSGEFSDPQKAYKITEKGKDALEIHRKERLHLIVGYIITGLTLAVTILQLIIGWIKG